MFTAASATCDGSRRHSGTGALALSNFCANCTYSNPRYTLAFTLLQFEELLILNVIPHMLQSSINKKDKILPPIKVSETLGQRRQPVSGNLFFKNNKRQSKLKSRSQTSDMHPFFLPQNALSQRIRYPSIRLSIKKNLSNAICNNLLELQSCPQSPQHEFFKTNLMPLESDGLTAPETPVPHLTASRVWPRQRL